MELYNKYFPILNNQTKPWWEMRKEYRECKKCPKMTPETWDKCTAYIQQLFEECKDRAPRGKDYYLIADTGRLFFERYDMADNWRNKTHAQYTLEQLYAYSEMAAVANAIPHEKNAEWGCRRTRGPPKVPRAQPCWCQCYEHGWWPDECCCDFDIPCNCEEDECTEECKQEKRELAREMQEEQRYKAYETAPAEERNIACYCYGQPMYITKPEGPAEYLSAEAYYGGLEFSLWVAGDNYPEILWQEGQELYTENFLDSDPTIEGKLEEAGLF